MKYLLVLFICLFTTATSYGQAFAITDFTSVGDLLQEDIGSSGDVTTDMMLLGGEIDYVVTSNNGNSRIAVTMEQFFIGTDVDGSIEYTWDGVDGDPFTTDYNTVLRDLGNCGDISIDFTESTFGASVLNFDLTIEMYNSASNYISWTGLVSLADVPVNVTVNTSQFQAFGGAFDFSDLRALKVILSTESGDNLQAGINSLSWVPDIGPGAMCDPMPAAPIPTMGQWGLIVLGLLMSIFAVVVLFSQNTSTIRVRA